jgi:formylmethanofuran dehydrogenase subunit E-like metal-binding protein
MALSNDPPNAGMFYASNGINVYFSSVPKPYRSMTCFAWHTHLGRGGHVEFLAKELVPIE